MKNWYLCSLIICKILCESNSIYNVYILREIKSLKKLMSFETKFPWR